MEKYWKLLVGLLAAALIITGVVTYVLYEKNYLVIKPKPKAPPAPPPEIFYPENKKDLKILVDNAVQLKAPSCAYAIKTTDRQKWMKCFNDSFEPAIRINGAKDKSLVRALIKLAKNTQYTLPPELQHGDRDMLTGYRALMCSVRMVCINTLAKLQDKRAIKPLIKIMDESYDTQYVGCYFGGRDSICRSAGGCPVDLQAHGRDQGPGQKHRAPSLIRPTPR